MIKRMAAFGGLVFIFVIALSACTPKPIVTATPTTVIPPTRTPQPTEVPPTPTPDPGILIEEIFATSAHANASAAAFTRWNAESEIPATCAKCHSAAGFQDFALDSKVDVAAPVPNAAFDCLVCHSDAVKAMTSVIFPSGAVITETSESLVCLNCHQGLQSKLSVDAVLVKFGESLDPDAVPQPYKDENGNDVNLAFIDIHYTAASATIFGAETKGGYQYNGNYYDIRNQHTELASSCIGCHDPHTLQLKTDTCTVCHLENGRSVDDMHNIREIGSASDHDGDGDVKEGIYFEINGLQKALYAAIQNYAEEVLGARIIHVAGQYPYWFNDADMDGYTDMDAGGKPVAFSNWSPRLLKAAYNYQLAVNDPGAYAHGGKYVIELLYDSLMDLNSSEKLVTKTDMSRMQREDPGHFDGAAPAWRHWDGATGAGEPYMVTGDCANCHTSSALGLILRGESIPEAGLRAGNGLACSTCHEQNIWHERYSIPEVTLSSGKAVSFGNGADSNLCLTCHQGRSAKVVIDTTLAKFDTAETDDAAIEPIKDILGNEIPFDFPNLLSHYLPVAGVWFGSEAQVAYEYDGKTYVGANTHAPVDEKTGCAGCHDMHSGEVKFEVCQSCHQDVGSPTDIRSLDNTTDWNGNGNVTEGMETEYIILREVLYGEILKYARARTGKAIVFNPEVYPYWFTDLNRDGRASEDESQFGNAYTNWTPSLVKAVYNYNFFANKNNGAGIHNGRYAIQVIYDAIEDLGGNIDKFTRP